MSVEREELDEIAERRCCNGTIDCPVIGAPECDVGHGGNGERACQYFVKRRKA